MEPITLVLIAGAAYLLLRPKAASTDDGRPAPTIVDRGIDLARRVADKGAEAAGGLVGGAQGAAMSVLDQIQRTAPSPIAGSVRGSNLPSTNGSRDLAANLLYMGAGVPINTAIATAQAVDARAANVAQSTATGRALVSANAKLGTKVRTLGAKSGTAMAAAVATVVKANVDAAKTVVTTTQNAAKQADAQGGKFVDHIARMF